jgi:hypothetical protein
MVHRGAFGYSGRRYDAGDLSKHRQRASGLRGDTRGTGAHRLLHRPEPHYQGQSDVAASRVQSDAARLQQVTGTRSRFKRLQNIDEKNQR